MEISCLNCQKNIKIPGFIDTNNYDGQLSCPECRSLLKLKLAGGKVRKYELVERGAESNPGQPAGEKVDVESIARYNPLRDYLSSYRARQLNLSLEHIENIIGAKLDTAAYTLKSWWKNDPKNPQANAWLEAGWEVDDIDLRQRGILFKKVRAG